MKFKDYLETLNQAAKLNPAILEYETVTANDDEGNGFTRIRYDPTVGNFMDDDNDFIPFALFEERGLTHDDINAICVN